MKYRFNLIIFCLIILLSYTPSSARQKNLAGNPLQPNQPGAIQKSDSVQMTDIHDIKPLEDIGGEFNIIYLILIIIFLILLGLVVVYLLKKKKSRADQTMVKTVPPEKIAFRLFDELESRKTWEIKEYYFKLSLILRSYIQGRFGINAPEMTSEEFLPQIKNLGLNVEIQNTLKEFVLFSDPIKFADISTDEAQMKQDMLFARDFVKRTTLAI